MRRIAHSATGQTSVLCTFKLWLWCVLKIVDVFRNNLPVHYQVALPVYHVGDHEDLQAAHFTSCCITYKTAPHATHQLQHYMLQVKNCQPSFADKSPKVQKSLQPVSTAPHAA